MKKILISLFSLLFLNCVNKAEEKSLKEKRVEVKNLESINNKKVLSYQNDQYFDNIGSGLLRINDVNRLKDIVCFLDENCTKPIIDNPKVGVDIVPFLNKSDYGILFLNCKKENEKSYTITSEKSRIVFLPKNNKVTYFSWESFIKDEVLGIEFKEDILGSYRESIKGEILNIKPSSEDEIEVLEVKEEWILINNLNMKKKYWIKWKDNNKILVYFNLLV